MWWVLNLDFKSGKRGADIKPNQTFAKPEVKGESCKLRSGGPSPQRGVMRGGAPQDGGSSFMKTNAGVYFNILHWLDHAEFFQHAATADVGDKINRTNCGKMAK